MTGIIRWAMAMVLVYSAPTFAEEITLREELSGFGRKVTCASSEAQAWFNQGFTLYFSYHQDAAIPSFNKAYELDPTCTMALWGTALTAGPHINNPAMDSASARMAYETIQLATHSTEHLTAVERDLVEALTHRYSWPQPADQMVNNLAYSNAMREVWKKYPDDVDVGVLFADAMMNLRPWDFWTFEGVAQPGTDEIVATLQRSLEMDPRHPGAAHFFIHTMEASPTPEVALPAANMLRDRIPGAGHLVHMPAHIDLRLGHYDEAIQANQRAIVASLPYAKEQNFFTIYRTHNYHFLCFAAMFEGRKQLALETGRGAIAQLDMAFVRMVPDFLDAFLGVPIHVMVRFGMWNEILTEPAPPEDMQTATVFWLYGRTVASSALGKVEEATAEFAKLQQACKVVPATRLVGNNPASVVLEIGLALAEGELEYRRGNFDHAFELLRVAVAKDERLKYDEPWDWMTPPAHALGALLLEQKKYGEAEEVYLADLKRHPENGWALLGLKECQMKTGRADLAIETEKRFQKSWERSDIAIKASCFCSQGI